MPGAVQEGDKAPSQWHEWTEVTAGTLVLIAINSPAPGRFHFPLSVDGKVIRTGTIRGAM